MRSPKVRPRLSWRRGRQRGTACRAPTANGRALLFAALGALAALLLLSFSGGATGTGTPAAESLNHAGLVIRHGDGRVTYAYVAFAEAELSGIELLERSGVEQVTIPFGGLGQGVCEIEGEGCPATECRRRVCRGFGADSPYWRYFGLDESGAWRPFALGASSTRVRDGDLHGWSWTAAEPGLPGVSLVDVARLAGAAVEDEGAGGEPRSFVRTVYPDGAEPPDADDDPDPLTYGAAGAVLVLIGGGALYALRRGRRGWGGGGPEEVAA